MKILFYVQPVATLFSSRWPDLAPKNRSARGSQSAHSTDMFQYEHGLEQHEDPLELDQKLRMAQFSTADLKTV